MAGLSASVGGHIEVMLLVSSTMSISSPYAELLSKTEAYMCVHWTLLVILEYLISWEILLVLEWCHDNIVKWLHIVWWWPFMEEKPKALFQFQYKNGTWFCCTNGFVQSWYKSCVRIVRKLPCPQKLTWKVFCPILLAIAATVAEGTLESEGREIASGKNLGWTGGNQFADGSWRLGCTLYAVFVEN
jgi:hypothetical protein